MAKIDTIDDRTLGRKAVNEAKAQIEKEQLEKAVKSLKDLYRKQNAAITVLENIEREIADMEEAINQGNLDG